MSIDGKAAKIKLVLFDVDGTLVDSNYLHINAWLHAFHDIGRPVDAWRIHQCIGMDSSTMLTELLGSMLLASVFAAIASSVIPLLSSNQPTSEVMATYIWLTIVATLGSWAILVPSKFVEGKLEDQVPMRITLMDGCRFSIGVRNSHDRSMRLRSGRASVRLREHGFFRRLRDR